MTNNNSDHPPVQGDQMFTPLTTVVSCDPQGLWFKLNWRWGMGRHLDKRDDYMYRENVIRLRDQLNALLEATSDGKTLQSGTLDPEEAKKRDKALRDRLAARSAATKAPQPGRAAKRGGKATERSDGTPDADVAPTVRKGADKAARIERELAKEGE